MASDKKGRPPQVEHLDSEEWTRYQEKLSISGYNVEDPFCLKDWTDSIHQWPQVEYGEIYTYLIDTPGTYTKDTLKAYKSLDAYRMYIAGQVYSVWYHPVSKESPLCALKSKVAPSQGLTEASLECWILVDKKSAEISSAHCTCMAGLGETCSHIAAVLFKVEACIRLNIQRLCSGEAEAWNNTYHKQVKPAAMKDIDFSSSKRKKKEKTNSSSKSKRNLQKGSEQKRPIVTPTDSTLALRRLWDINKTAVIFTTYPKHVYRHESETDTASECEDECLNPALPINNPL